VLVSVAVKAVCVAKKREKRYSFVEKGGLLFAQKSI
jgi:hypothetical protein